MQEPGTLPPALPAPRHRLAILALDGFVPYDLCVPHEIFTGVTLPDGQAPYDVCFIGPAETARSGHIHITGCLPPQAMPDMHTIVVPGLVTPFGYRDEQVFAALREAARCGVRLASICSGACVLAACGLLDGLTATTHWALVDRLAADHPMIRVEREVLYCDNGHILTSAGLAAGMDLCLHMIRKDHGALAADATAKLFVVPVERDGSHRQVIRRVPPQDRDNIAALQAWLLENLHGRLSLADMAGHACMSARTLNRKFQQQTGMPPMAWLARARVLRAQSLLESGGLSVERIAELTGLGTAAALRESFRRVTGMSPAAWRKTYGGSR
ncbi:GlxA family transcriptional regulator [Nitratidesulfovibrio sp. D1]|uniref:GlxA family transcriptional regulator n=1 Tax=Nitratidesulfovibrio sp. D1 TaxID=3440151 RepID=UPI003EBA1F91